MDEFIQMRAEGVAAVVAVAGALVGLAVAFWSERLCRNLDQSVGAAPQMARRAFALPYLVAGMLVFMAYFSASLLAGGLSVSEVRPDPSSIYLRAAGHLVLISLLLAATSTDLREYIIPDQITVPGTVIGLLLATVAGDTQIMHLWVDWNHPLVGVTGPEIPAWIAQYRYLHGFAWSVCGMLAGGGITLLVQRLSALILGQEALGPGDITLMALIGSFLGWQAVLIVFLISPLCGVAFGLTVRFATNKSYVPYGPYLACGAFLTLLGWRWIWELEVENVFSVRRLFGDAQGLAMLGGIALAGFVVLLTGVRLFRSIPGRDRSVS
ncbi:MAG: prepilin peptidase [Planctomycetota bacterium]|jgi:leader peptidase (prepilin peptidase)/N-methyltransferase